MSDNEIKKHDAYVVCEYHQRPHHKNNKTPMIFCSKKQELEAEVEAILEAGEALAHTGDTMRRMIDLLCKGIAIKEEVMEQTTDEWMKRMNNWRQATAAQGEEG